MGSAGHNRFTDATFKRGVCAAGFTYIFIYLYMNICVHTYTNMYTHSFYMLNFLLCSKAFAAPPHPECTGHVFLEAFLSLYTTWVLPHAQYSL